MAFIVVVLNVLLKTVLNEEQHVHAIWPFLKKKTAKIANISNTKLCNSITGSCVVLNRKIGNQE